MNGESGLSKAIRDRLQGHALQDVSSKSYDRYSYLPEKREAVSVWDAFLQDVIAGKPADRKVVRISA